MSVDKDLELRRIASSEKLSHIPTYYILTTLPV